MLLTGVWVGRGSDRWLSRRYFGCSSMLEILLVNFLMELGWEER